MNKPTSTSLIKILEENAEKLNDSSVHDHIMIVLESDENGAPNGKVVKVKGHPFGVLGMIDMITEQLSTIREGIIKKFNEADEMSQNFKTASSTHRNRLKELENAARIATEQGDEDALEAIKRQLIDLLKKMKLSNDADENSANNDGTSKGGEFRIDDFKGGF